MNFFGFTKKNNCCKKKISKFGEGIGLTWNAAKELFKILHSFDFAGIGVKRMNITPAINPSVLGGASSYSINVMFNISEESTGPIFVSNNIGSGQPTGLILAAQFGVLRRLQYSAYDSGSTLTNLAISTNGVVPLNQWNFATFVYDKTQNEGNRGKFFVNGVDVGTDSDDLTNVEDTKTNLYEVARGLDGLFNSASVINRVITLAEHQDYYNNGEPKDPQALFGSDCKLFLNPDNSGNTAPFTITDSINGFSATSINMQDIDKTTNNPYS
jgi:hypothetical protein